MKSLIETALELLESETAPKILGHHTTPDKAYFDGFILRWFDSNGPFAFIGKDKGVLVYNSDKYGTHNELYTEINTYQKVTKKGYSIFGTLSKADIDYAVDTQDIENEDNDDSRVLTRSGRIWKDVASITFNQNVNVVAFWCKEHDVKKTDLESLKKNLKLDEFFWVGIDSKYYNQYGEEVQELGGNEVATLTKDEIKKILATAHEKGIATLSTRDRDIVKRSRGGMDIEAILKNMKRKSGGFSSMSQRNAAMWTSEETEH